MYNTSKAKGNKFLKEIEPISNPSILNAIIYLMIPTYLILNIIPPTRAYMPKVNYMYLKFFIAMFGATYAYKDLEPYIKKVGNFQNTIKISFKIIIAYGLTCVLIPFIAGKDPQGINAVNFTDIQYFNLLLDLPFTAIGEEVVKMLMLLAFLRLLKPLKITGIVLSIIMASAIFGLFHINYNYDNALNIMVAIGVTAIPSYIFFLRYKSIYPPMIAHFIIDLGAFSAHSQNFGFVWEIILIILMAVMFVYMFKSINNIKQSSNVS